jgi:aminopeptidase N
MSNQFLQKLRRSLGFVSLFVLAGCMTSKDLHLDATWRQAKDLTQKMAEFRKHQISDVNYVSSVRLAEDQETYTGKQSIRFVLKEEGDVWLEFRDGAVLDMVINGNLVSDYQKGEIFVQLPKRYLKLGLNVVEMNFEQKYSTDGVGLHRFEDPEDGRVYMYTNLQPWDANRFLPFFDQPDLKANFDLTVEAPGSWQVIGNSPGQVLSSGKTKKWHFPSHKPISTYLMALHAGPYHKWTDSYKGRSGTIQLGLFVRQSLAKYVDEKTWFSVTKKGFGYFESYFDQEYPFGNKYDQVIVPEFNSGAMENVAAVTFGEENINRGPSSRQEVLWRYNTVMHELSHMWFGNLVTMKWWDDLWLNESFATYMANRALVDATEFKDAWMDFHADKLGAYREDRMSTTHPVAASIENTNEALSNFDDITYGKGASVLKQFVAVYGDDVFKKGIRKYFAQHAWGNTTFQDFVATFEGQDVKGWFSSWLESTGADEIQSKWVCTGKENVTVFLKLKTDNDRRHAIDVVLFDGRADKLLVSVKKSVVLDKRGLTIDFSGLEECPAAIMVNANDLSYVDTPVDAKSLEVLLPHVLGIEDPLLRMQGWTNLYKMLVKGQLDVKEFAKVAQKSMLVEKESYVRYLLDHMVSGEGWGRYSSLAYFLPTNTPEEIAYHEDYFSQNLKNILLAIKKEKRQGELSQLYLMAMNSATYRDVGELEDLLRKAKSAEIRWPLIVQICQLNGPQCRRLVEKESRNDKSDIAVNSRYKIEMLRKPLSDKLKFLNEKAKDENLSYDMMSYSLYHLFSDLDFDEMEKNGIHLTEEVLADAVAIDEAYHSLIPSEFSLLRCEANNLRKTKSAIESYKDLPSTLRIGFMQRIDQDKDCLVVRKALHEK